MKIAKIIYEEKNTLTVQYYKQMSNECLEYNTNIKIKDSGENPIEISLSFSGTPPFNGIMPPEKHTIRAPSIFELNRRIISWFKKYGYILK